MFLSWISYIHAVSHENNDRSGLKAKTPLHTIYKMAAPIRLQL